MRSAHKKARTLAALLRKLRRAPVADVCSVNIAAVRLHSMLSQAIPAGGVLFAGAGADGVAAEGAYVENAVQVLLLAKKYNYFSACQQRRFVIS